MKKAMLYISLYAEVKAPFILPVAGLFVCIVMLAAVIVFAVLLLRADDNNMQAHMETAAVVVFAVLIVLMPWIFALLSVIQVQYYSNTAGAMGVAAYSVLQQGIAACNPILVFSMLLQIIYAGISLGRKGR